MPTLLAPLLLLACSGNADDTGPQADCATTPVEACADTPGCTPAVASALLTDAASGRDCWAQERGNAVCVEDRSFGSCGDAETPAAPADDPTACLLFPNTCVPPGWADCSAPPELTCPTCVADTAPVPLAPHAVLTGAIGLGRALAAPGDVNGDGHPDLLTARKLGAVLFYGPFVPGDRELGQEDTWWDQAEEDDRAATVLAAGADLTGDGFPDLAIGAPLKTLAGEANGPGGVYVLTGPYETGLGWLADAAMAIDGETYGDGAGSSLTIGDLDDDGHPDLVIAAPYTDTQGSQSGTLYVLSGPLGPGTPRLADARTTILGSGTLGRPLGVADVNDDGADDLIYSVDPATIAVLHGPLAAGTLQASAGVLLTAAGAIADQVTAVAAGDLDGDGATDLAWAADDEAHGRGAGAVWGSSTPLTASQSVTPETSILGRCEWDDTGLALAFGDVNGDGIDDLLVGGSGRSSTPFGVAVFLGPVDAGSLLITDADHWLGEGAASALVVTDLDGDDVQDVASGSADNDAIHIWFGGSWP